MANIAGWAVTWFAPKAAPWPRVSRPALLLVLVAVFCSVTALYLALLALGADPNWSTSAALQW